MTNRNDIVFADGSVIKAGCLEYLGATYHSSGCVICEFREYKLPEEEPRDSALLNQIIKEIKKDA